MEVKCKEQIAGKIRVTGKPVMESGRKRMTTDGKFKLPPVNMAPSDDDQRKFYDYNFCPLEGKREFTYIGALPCKKSVDINASPIGVGYETLDRDTFDPKDTYALMAKSGVKWSRVQTGWNKCEKSKGKYDFKWLDEIVDSLLAIGIQPWLSVSFGNAHYTPVPGYATWAADHPGEAVPAYIRSYVGEVPLYHGKAAVRGWENYLSVMAKHYKGRVSHWEIWNEPNTMGGFWRMRGAMPYPELPVSERVVRCAADYVELVKISGAQIRAAIPDAKIVAGSLSNGMEINNYVVALAENRIVDHADIISYHPYGVVPEQGAEARFNFIRHNIGSCTIPIWQGEAGRPAGDCFSPEYGPVATEYNQAKYVTRRFVTDLRIGVEMSSFFAVSDFGGYLVGEEMDCGILDRLEKRPKLAFYALQAMGYLFDGLAQAPDIYSRWHTAGRFNLSSLRYQLVTAQFRRKGVPLFCVYFPETPDISFDPGEIELNLFVQKSDKFDCPVAVDPIWRKVYKINNVDSLDGQGFTFMRHFPFTDYPLFVTDHSVIVEG